MIEAKARELEETIASVERAARDHASGDLDLEALGPVLDAARRELARLKAQVTPTDATLLLHERHNDDWHEWSMATTAKKDEPQARPYRLFVRVETGCMIVIEEARVTSFSAHARQVDSKPGTSLSLTNDMAEFLMRVLPLAYLEKNRG